MSGGPCGSGRFLEEAGSASKHELLSILVRDQIAGATCREASCPPSRTVRWSYRATAGPPTCSSPSVSVASRRTCRPKQWGSAGSDLNDRQGANLVLPARTEDHLKQVTADLDPFPDSVASRATDIACRVLRGEE